MEAEEEKERGMESARKSVCVCVRACVGACVRACVRACVHVCVREIVKYNTVSQLFVSFFPHITVEYAQIDWHSFVIVETINFRESEAGKKKKKDKPS